MRTYTVYRFYNADGDVLYVGCARDLRQRTQSHRKTKHWWPQVADIQFEEIVGRRAAYAHERQLIAQLEPKHNKLPEPPDHQQQQVCERSRSGRPTAEDMYPLDEWADDLAHRRRTMREIGAHHGISRQAVSQHMQKYRADWMDRRKAIDAAVAAADAAELAQDCRACGKWFMPRRGGAQTCSSACSDLARSLRYHTNEDRWQKQQFAIARWNLDNLTDSAPDYQVEYWRKTVDGRDDEIERHGRWLVEGSATWDAAVEVVERGLPLADELHPDVREQVESHLSERSAAA